MRFMMLMIPKGYENAKPGTLPDAKAIATMMKYNESLQKAGVLLGLDGLHPPSMGARVSFSAGKAKVTDGPFGEAKEVIGGFWMIQVKSKEEALEWASRCPASDNEVIEVRQVLETSDFPADVKEGTVKLHEQLFDPQSPWQRGTNENTNLLLRQYFPRETDLSVHSQAQLDHVALRLKSTPQKSLRPRNSRE